MRASRAGKVKVVATPSSGCWRGEELYALRARKRLLLPLPATNQQTIEATTSPSPRAKRAYSLPSQSPDDVSPSLPRARSAYQASLLFSNR